MVVEYIAVRCFDNHCGLFGVIQKPKSNCWECRVCHAKQSVRKIYAISFKAADVRQVVSKLNYEVGTRKEFGSKRKETEQIETTELILNEETKKKRNKWEQFLDLEELQEVNHYYHIFTF